MIQATTVPTSTQGTIKQLKTAIFASALSAGLILLILLLRDSTFSGLKRVFETILFAFLLGTVGANVYI
ncbi:MAG TPA: hypothetical protein VFW94_12220 [Candidatus Acidoferrales bacterium]|nr:hypothetical protein [Candidatus Acidoferrales bacterium]